LIAVTVHPDNTTVECDADLLEGTAPEATIVVHMIYLQRAMI
jgi:hypothetical protein